MQLIVLVCLMITANASPNLIEKANSIGANTLVNLVRQAKLSNTLSHGGPYTIFAPSDQAFNAVPPNILSTLSSNITLLQEVLEYHVAKGAIISSDIFDDFQIPSLVQYKKMRVNKYGSVYTVNGCKIVSSDIMASNGIIHVIDCVLYPLPSKSFVEYAGSQERFSQLVYNAIRANLLQVVSGDGPFTVFAPTDAAFYALPTGYVNSIFLNQTLGSELIKYHILNHTVFSVGLMDNSQYTTVSGSRVTARKSANGVMINNSTVTEADVLLTNGVLHVVDQVLIPENLRNI